MPNSFAYVVLLTWPLVAIGLFRLLPFERALIWSILGAYLLLPPLAAFDLPVIPALDKESLPNLAVLLICIVMLGRRVPVLPNSHIAKVLLGLLVLGPFATVLTNAEPVFFGPLMLPGMRPYDAGAMVAEQLLFLLPFLLARRFLATAAAQREIMLALALGGLLYSVPMLIEIRLSPQLNIWIYGFFQHAFDQMMRQGGFRPIVFLSHGLLVAFFVLTSLIATVALCRGAGAGKRAPYIFAAGYLAVLLVLCKSLGSLVYALALVPLVAFAGRRMQLHIAALLAIIAIGYPVLRDVNFVPVEAMVSWAEAVNPDRADSLNTRLQNEAAALERASEKPLFGWGGWGRNSLYDHYTGRETLILDGRWIIVMGMFGWCGFIGEFGLLALPLLLLFWRLRRSPSDAIPPFLGPLALILAVTMIELLPNASIIPFTWLVAGSLLGYAEALKEKRVESPVEALPSAAAGRTVLEGAIARRRPIL